MADAQDDLPAHEQTYQAFNKLVLFSSCSSCCCSSCMGLGLVGSQHIFALLLGIGGTIALLVAFAVVA